MVKCCLRFFIQSTVILFLASCSVGNLSQKLLNNINVELKKNCNVDYGALAATYNLARISSGENCLYASDFGKIINEPAHNALFIKKFQNRCQKNLQLSHRASDKSAKIRDLLLKLDSKYHFLSKSDLYFVRSVKPRSDDIFDAMNGGERKDSIADLIRLDSIINIIPIMIPEYKGLVTSNYGLRIHPIKGQEKFHCGLDLKSSNLSAVYASAAGIVTRSEWSDTYGNIVEITHSPIFKTRYAHLKKSFVERGMRVIRGQSIGTQGRTGKCTGEHLHLEIWLRDKHVDPFDFVAHACKC